MYSPNDHNKAFACCGEKFLFKKPLNYSHTTFLTLCQDKFKLELTDTNLVNFWVGYRKLRFYTTSSCLLWLSLLQFIFLFICNPTICNPGPISSPQFKLPLISPYSIKMSKGLYPLVILRKITPNWITIKFLNLTPILIVTTP